MRLAANTNRHTDLCRGDKSVVETVELTNNMWIAALAVQHSLTLCDRNAHFNALPQLIRT